MFLSSITLMPCGLRHLALSRFFSPNMQHVNVHGLTHQAALTAPTTPHTFHTLPLLAACGLELDRRGAQQMGICEHHGGDETQVSEMGLSDHDIGYLLLGGRY